MPKSYRFKKRVSDRSGFDFLERELIKQAGNLVGPDEYDTPPPSTKPTGAEGEVSPGYTRTGYDTYSTPAGMGFNVQNLTASSQISFVTGDDDSGQTDTNFQWVYVTGSNQEVILSSNPQITGGYQNAQFQIQCVGSSVTLIEGNGLALTGAKNFRMTSGSTINFFYSATDNLWHETNRNADGF